MPDTDFPKRLRDFHSRLSPELQYDFRRILDDFASYYFEIGDIFKQTVIDLIPSKIQTEQSVTQVFKPQAKPKNGDPLQELLFTMTPEQKQALLSKLETKK